MVTKTWYLSIENEEMWRNRPSDEEESDSPVYHYQNGDLSYHKIDNFMGDDKRATLREEKLAAKSQNIIIDLRGNFGGTNQFIQDNLYSQLFPKNAVSKRNMVYAKI